MVEGLPTIEGKQALCIGTLRGNIGGVERLQKKPEEAINWGDFDGGVIELFQI